MKNNYLKAITLTELLVASAVVGFVLLGITASNTILQKSSQDFSASYFVAQSTQNSLNHILKNASMAVGSLSYPGYFYQETGAAGTQYRAFCFNQTTDDPSDSSKANWVCYTWTHSDLGSVKDLRWCRKAIGVPPDSCSGVDPLLGTAKNVTPTFTPGGLFTVTIDHCLNDNAASCCDPSADPACKPDPNNPYVTKTGSVYPSAYGTG